MGTLGLGDLLGQFEGENDGGLAHVTINALAKRDVCVGAANAFATIARSFWQPRSACSVRRGC